MPRAERRRRREDNKKTCSDRIGIPCAGMTEEALLSGSSREVCPFRVFVAFFVVGVWISTGGALSGPYRAEEGMGPFS